VAPAVVWFRRDLRLDDLPSLSGAVAAGADGVVPLFVIDPAVLGPSGPNRRRFLAGSLRSLDRELGGTLVLRHGDPVRVVPDVAAEVGATTVVATADFGPYGSGRDRTVGDALRAAGRRLVTVGTPYAVPPGTVRTAGGDPFRVYSAFRRRWGAVGWEPPVPPPAVRFVGAPGDATLGDLDTDLAGPGRRGLPPWWEGLPLGPAGRLPEAGAPAARARLSAFAAGPLADYAGDRDLPGRAGTSGLSPYLRFGCIHPRTVLHGLGSGEGPDRMRDELAWREFYADVLWNVPGSARNPWQPFGRALRFDDGPQAWDRFGAWATGTTGYPLVDAGMRQLLAEGWMHNRVRMVTASFLVKDLHLDWRLGARWFMWHLVDGDLASNQHGWQWVAGTGTDAAPFHRILNPQLQLERFDPGGEYVSRYLGGPDRPDRPGGGTGPGRSGRLFDLPGTGGTPVVDHARERVEALARFAEARGRADH